MGEPPRADAVLFLGLHAASGGGGFLPHTLTSRIARLEVNGRIMTEVELFAAALTMRDGGDASEKLAETWKLSSEGDRVFIDAPDMQKLFMELVRVCYLSPVIERAMPAGLWLSSIAGWLGLLWAGWKSGKPV